VRHTKNRTTVRRGSRLARKVPRNKKRPNYGFLFSLFFTSVFISGAGSYALRTPDLCIRKVSVDGVRLCNKAQIEEKANAFVGKNILIVRKSGVADGILGFSEVESVRIGRALPDKMWVTVRERTADAVITNGRGYFLTQDDGYIFHRVDGPEKKIPLIELKNSERLKSGYTAHSADARYALDVLRSAREKKLPVVKISVDPVGDICLNMDSGFYVKLGQPDDIARKMSLLKNALACRPSIAREAIYIDLSCPSAPVWKPKVVAQNAL